MSGRIPVSEIAARLSIGRLAVYAMLEQGIIQASGLGIGGSSRGTPSTPGSAPADRPKVRLDFPGSLSNRSN